ncbi:MAG: flagellar biosynthesis protein FlaG [Colwelliaceae bacterium]|nr:flagellar biosynthesis protein FlaG [Colwelliaceae bacterium]
MAIEQVRESSVFAKTNAEPLSDSVGANIARELKETETNEAVDKAEFSSIKARLEEEQVEKEEDKSEVEQKSISEVIEFLNSELPMVKTSLVFEFDELNEPPIVKVVDRDNGETIREIPPKYLKEVSESLQDVANSLSNSGVLFDKKV